MQKNVIESNLGKNESIIRQADISMAALVPRVILGLVFIVLGPLGLVITALLIVEKVIDLKSIKMVLTDRRLLGKMGIIGTKDMDVPLNKINTISVEKKLFGQILGYAQVIVGTSSGQYNLKYVKDADTFRNTVMEQIDRLEEYKMQQQAQQFAQVNHMYGGYAAPNYAQQPYGGQGYGNQYYGGQPNGQLYAGQSYGAQPYGGQPSGGQLYAGQSYGEQPYGGQQ